MLNTHDILTDACELDGMTEQEQIRACCGAPPMSVTNAVVVKRVSYLKIFATSCCLLEQDLHVLSFAENIVTTCTFSFIRYWTSYYLLIV